MWWYIYAILGAFFSATYYALIKRKLQNTNQYALSAGVFLAGSILLFLISIINGIPEIGSAFYLSVPVTVVINVAAATLYFKALKTTDISLALPMISFTPVFLILTSFIILNEFPTTFGLAGIFLIVVGSYILNTTNHPTRLLDPFKKISKNKGALYMLIVAFLFSIGANFDKLVVKNSDPIFGSSIVLLFIGLSFLIIASKTKNVSAIYKKNIPSFFLIGAVLALTIMTINIAFTMQIVPYVISIKRLSIMFSVFYGCLIFKEKHIIRRGMGALVMLLGVILIILL